MQFAMFTQALLVLVMLGAGCAIFGFLADGGPAAGLGAIISASLACIAWIAIAVLGLGQVVVKRLDWLRDWHRDHPG